MGSPLPPDPYVALGVPKVADQAAIKAAHRKLVLKCHPDKVTDPDAKQAASDTFHKIQTAYEILIDQNRRERYDAQVRLAELRKEALERQGGKSSRGADRSAPSPYKSSQDAAPRGSYNARSAERVVPQYEERRPAYAADYFDQPSRSTARKEPEYERSYHRRPVPDHKDKGRSATRETKEKELERERRRERARRADQDARRDRDRKFGAAHVEDDDSDSDSDDHTRVSRRMRNEDELRRARDAYNETAYRQSQQASSGYFEDPRAKKMFTDTANAWDHMRSSGSRQKSEAERRPSPVRHGSSKDKFDYIRGKDGRPTVVRRGSERPKASSRDSERRPSPREPEQRSSTELMDEARRAAMLHQSRSSPADIKLPPTDKPRAQSVQVEKDNLPEIPSVKRADTMPYNTSRRSENAVPQRSRPTEFTEGLATPATTPEFSGAFAPNASKFSYGSQYADDREYPTPDGYRTEVRQPAENSRPKFTRKVTRSPSPVKDTREPREFRDPWDSRERDRPRNSSLRHPESSRPEFKSRTTSYVYTPSGVEQIDRSRPTSGRAPDARDSRSPLYGEIRQPAGSPRTKYSSYDAPEESDVRYTRPTRADNIRVASGYDYRRASADRPSMSRNGSGNPIYTSARA